MERLWLSLKFDAGFPGSQAEEACHDGLQNSCYQEGGDMSLFIGKLMSIQNSKSNILHRAMCRRLWVW